MVVIVELLLSLVMVVPHWHCTPGERKARHCTPVTKEEREGGEQEGEREARLCTPVVMEEREGERGRRAGGRAGGPALYTCSDGGERGRGGGEREERGERGRREGGERGRGGGEREESGRPSFVHL